MKTPIRLALVLACTGLAPALRADDPLPRSWIDPDTGHRVIQLSVEPNTSSLYFTQYGYCDGGTRLIMFRRGGIDLVKVSTGEIENVYQGTGFRVIQAGRKSGNIYYEKDGALFALDPATKVSRRLATLPEHGSLNTINCDETLAAGSITEGGERGERGLRAFPATVEALKPGEIQQGTDDTPNKMAMMIRRHAEARPMTLFTLNLQTGERKDLYHTTDWINHFQFSPKDPTLMSFAHEGPWWLTDRAWLFRADGHSEPMLIHKRTMRMEIANHEYWSADGQWLWYDLETPMNQVFWIAGYNVYTGQRIWYHLTLDQWSIHYNRSPDGTMFSGDGGEPGHLGPQPPHSKWLYLFHPKLLPDQQPPPSQPGLIQTGSIETERLVNLAKHEYSLEPNGNFTPDGKWIVFRSNMRGPIEVYAVEVAKAGTAAAQP